MRLAQALPQAARPGGQPALRHLPATQSSLAGHFWPQPPQLAALLWTSMQLPSQTSDPAGQVQAPLMHDPVPQLLPHAPQLAASVARLTQAFELAWHMVVGAGQASHLPLLQIVQLGQALPQPPQFARSVAVATHLLLLVEAQSSVPLGQAHWPWSQIWV